MSTAEMPYFLKRFADPHRMIKGGGTYDQWKKLWAKAGPLIPDSDISELNQWMTRIQSHFEAEMQLQKDYVPADIFSKLQENAMEDGKLDTPDCNLKVSYLIDKVSIALINGAVLESPTIRANSKCT